MATPPLQIGSKYGTFADLAFALRTYEAEHCVQYYVRSSRSLEAAQKRAPYKRYNADLRFSEIDYACVRGGKTFKPFVQGKRAHSNTSNHQQCQSLIRVRTTEDHGHLYIKELRDVHNHEPEGDGGKRAKSNNSSSSCVEVSTTSDEISPLENYLQVVTASHSFDPSPFETLSAVSSSKPYELPSSGGGDPSADALQHLQMQHAEEVHRAQMIQLQRSIQLAEDEHQARMELIRRKLEVADLKFEYWTEQRKLQQKQ